MIISIQLNCSIALCIRENPKRVLLQTVKTQMKCSIMLHFMGVYTVCNGKKKEKIFFENQHLTSLDMYNGLSQVYCIKPEGRIHYYTKGLLRRSYLICQYYRRYLHAATYIGLALLTSLYYQLYHIIFITEFVLMFAQGQHKTRGSMGPGSLTRVV